MANQPIIVDGITYEADELFQRRLLIKGAEPTQYEQYDYVNVLVDHRNRKETSSGLKAAGMAQATYRYGQATDIHKFHEHEYPYYVDTKMVTITDKKQNQVNVIVWVDFANVEEMELVQRKPTNAKDPITTPVAKRN